MCRAAATGYRLQFANMLLLFAPMSNGAKVGPYMKYLREDFLLRPLVREDFEIVSVYENRNRLHL